MAHYSRAVPEEPLPAADLAGKHGCERRLHATPILVLQISAFAVAVAAAATDP